MSLTASKFWTPPPRLGNPEGGEALVGDVVADESQAAAAVDEVGAAEVSEGDGKAAGGDVGHVLVGVDG